MKRRYTEEQIIAILREQEAGGKVKEIIRRHGISEQSFYRWKAKYGGLEVSDVRRLRELEVLDLLRKYGAPGAVDLQPRLAELTVEIPGLGRDLDRSAALVACQSDQLH